MSVASEAECRELLASTEIGRVIVSIDALPGAFPVNFRVVDDAIVFRTRPGTKLSAAMNGWVVGFEVDDLDPATCSGWSVLVVGMSTAVTDAAEVAALARHNIQAWAGDSLSYYISISLDRISGRRILPALV